MRTLIIPAQLLVVAMLGCGVGASGGANVVPEPATAASQAALKCSAAPRLNADGTATQVGCSFIQHTINVAANGSRLGSAGVPLTAGDGVVYGHVTDQCGVWLLGEDLNHVTILVNADTGEVQSHGSVHPGEDVSNLPSALPLPLQVQTTK